MDVSLNVAIITSLQKDMRPAAFNNNKLLIKVNQDAHLCFSLKILYEIEEVLGAEITGGE
jgi:hypothetical protein